MVNCMQFSMYIPSVKYHICVSICKLYYVAETFVECVCFLSRCGLNECYSVVFFLGRPYVYFHSVCMLCLSYNCLFRCSIPMHVLYCMRKVISKFISESLRSYFLGT